MPEVTYLTNIIYYIYFIAEQIIYVHVLLSCHNLNCGITDYM